MRHPLFNETFQFSSPQQQSLHYKPGLLQYFDQSLFETNGGCLNWEFRVGLVCVQMMVIDLFRQEILLISKASMSYLFAKEPE